MRDFHPNKIITPTRALKRGQRGSYLLYLQIPRTFFSRPISLISRSSLLVLFFSFNFSFFFLSFAIYCCHEASFDTLSCRFGAVLVAYTRKDHSYTLYFFLLSSEGISHVCVCVCLGLYARVQNLQFLADKIEHETKLEVGTKKVF